MLHQLVGERHGRANILRRDIVLLLNVLEAHAARDLRQNSCNRNARPLDHRLSVVDARVDFDAVVHDEDYTITALPPGSRRPVNSPNCANGSASGQPGAPRWRYHWIKT